MKVTGLDHLVLTVEDVDRTVDFYVRVMGMEEVVFGEGRRALRFGDQKLNLHQAGREIEPKAARPTAGSADLCFLVDTPVGDLVSALPGLSVAIEEGPVRRTGAVGPLESIYLRDPDGNLVELSNRVEGWAR